MELNEIASDKTKTYNFFIEKGIQTPKVYTNEELEKKAYKFPLLIKPLDGSSSKGVTKISNEKELVFFREYIPNAMVQEFVEGTEYTVDVMVDFKGNIKTIVPRRRIETRAGEVSKGVTEKNETIINAVEEVVNLLPKPVGCLTLQCFKKSSGEITFIEINPRFGGGIPLSIQAGANFPLWTIQASKGETFDVQDYSWQENLTMLRYDEAVFTKEIHYAY
jgi:carbamoyl-phosphate synthase large subunit